ncbi:MAG: oligosaccharide flippase family protein [Erysipelotrichaceae bacterium]|nr:oligosaccharide flippase family protein [Erysipelotrichaceae bacterium]
MNKFKLFIENFIIYGLGGIISKIIPLVMVPIVTRMMPDTSYFGISDLSNTILALCSSLAIMGMYDAMYRMFFEKEDEGYKKDICSTAFIFTIFSSLVIFVAMILARNLIARWFLGDSQYGYLVYIVAIAVLVGSTNTILSAPTRMQNKRMIYLITNAASPLLSYAVAIPLLLNGHYIIALPVSGMVAGITMEIAFGILNHSWFSFRRFNLDYLKQMLLIAVPLLPNFLIYWIFNSSDRLMITNLIGLGASGIYSVGAKLGNASQLIYIAFGGGWQYFAFSTMKDTNQVESNSRIFEYLGVISFVCATFIFALSQSFYELLFTGEYVAGYIVAPYLFLAPLLQMLFQVACNQFLVVKKTWPNFFILSLGAVVNVFLNLALIPRFGIEGAAIATLIGYVVSDILAVIVLTRMKLMRVQLKFFGGAIIMVLFMAIWRLLAVDSPMLGLVLALCASLMIAWPYAGDVRMLFGSKK